MKRGSIFVCSVLVFGLLCFLCIKFHAPIIENDIENRLKAHLFANDLNHVTIAVSGRDIHLSGFVLNQKQAEQAHTLAANLRGVRKVNGAGLQQNPSPGGSTQGPDSNQNLEAQEVKNHQLLMRFDGNNVVLEGSSPTKESYAFILSFILAKLGPDRVQDNVEIRPPDVARWSGAGKALAQALLSSMKGEALLEKERWQLSSSVPHAGERTRIQSELFQTMPPHFKGHLDLKLALSKNAIQCQEAFDQILAGQEILFQTQSAEISSASQSLLADLAKVAKSCPTATLQIAGHTDSSGDPTQNFQLSRARAEAVKASLTALGVEKNGFLLLGLGSEFPIASNEHPQGRAQNRRIEIHVMESSP